MCALLCRAVRKGSNFDPLLCGLSLSVSARPRWPAGYTFGPGSLRQPHPAQQVGVAGIGAQVIKNQARL
jgi:hypothetical protein